VGVRFGETAFGADAAAFALGVVVVGFEDFAFGARFAEAGAFFAGALVVSAGVPLFPSFADAVARFSLRRCGRVRGSEPRTSGGRSSLIGSQMMAQIPDPCGGARRRSPQFARAARKRASSAQTGYPIRQANGKNRHFARTYPTAT
jgi:hypothetical protein